MPVGLCDGNCNDCTLINHNNSRLITKLLNTLYEEFGDDVLNITNDLCPNLTYCRDCHVDSFSHIEGCLLSPNTQVDSEFNGPKFKAGDRVEVLPIKRLPATVIKQSLHYDGPESFWGDVEVIMDDTCEVVTTHSWQLRRIN